MTNPETQGTILIIDDEPDIRKILEINLSMQNFRTVSASDGKEGISMAELHKPDLILLDMMMPGMDGNEVCRILQKNENTRAIPVIFLTAKEAMESKIEGLQSGAVDYITKPFEMVELTARIKSQYKIQILHKEVQNYVKQIEGDLDLARQVQKSILPHKIPYFKNLNIAARYFASETVGGDYYDIIKLGPDELALLVTDVSGHGIAAAFITAMAKMAFLHKLQKIGSLPKILDEINREFNEILQTDHYLTAFVCILNTSTRNLRYAKAGHINQFLYRHADKKCEILKTSGFFIGSFDNGAYEEKSTTLYEGDKIILFTDGLTECKNSSEEQYGSERLKKFLESHSNLDSSTLTKMILQDQSHFLKNNERADDFSLMIADISSDHIVENLRNEYPLEDSADINLESFDTPGTFGEKIERLSDRLELSGYRSKFLREARMCLNILLVALHKNLDRDDDNIQFLWQDSGDSLTFISFITRGGDLRDFKQDSGLKNIFTRESDTFYDFLCRVFDSVMFVMEGNALILQKNKRKSDS